MPKCPTVYWRSCLLSKLQTPTACVPIRKLHSATVAEKPEPETTWPLAKSTAGSHKEVHGDSFPIVEEVGDAAVKRVTWRKLSPQLMPSNLQHKEVIPLTMGPRRRHSHEGSPQYDAVLQTYGQPPIRTSPPAVKRTEVAKLPLNPTSSRSRHLRPRPSRRYVVRLQNLRQPYLRSKSISLGVRQVCEGGSTDEGTNVVTYLDNFSTFWSTQYAMIIAPYDRKQSISRMRLAPQRDRTIRMWFLKLGADWTDENPISRVWYKYSVQELKALWERVMLWMLKTDPLMALRILEATITHPLFKPPKHAVEDSLDYIGCTFLQDVEAPDVIIVKKITDLVCNFLSTYGARGGIVSITQRTIFLLSKHCDTDGLISLYRCLEMYVPDIHINTRLQLATRFCDQGNLGFAVEALQRVVESGADLDSPPIQSVCVRLLRTEFDLDTIYNIRCSILAKMLELGIRPNRQLYNTILLNAMHAGDCQTGWRIYEIAKENGLMPDAYTYAILLKGMKFGHDSYAIENVYHSAMQDGILSKSPRLVTEVLHALYIAERNERTLGKPKAYEALLPTYLRFFDAQPLLDLGMPAKLPDKTLGQRHDLATPHPAALGVLILAYLEQYQAGIDCFDMYSQYMRLVEHGHPIIAPLAATTHTANAFLMVLGRQSQTLHRCTTVIEHMLRRSTVRRDVTCAAEADAIATCRPIGEGKELFPVAEPDVQSWSILALGFIRHGQTAAAEKVMSLMRARGTWPTQTTWNTLVAGYLHLQNFEGAVETIDRMEEAGFAADDHTRKALGRVGDRKKLMEAFELAMKKDERQIGGNQIQ
ncbi:hypothetical protein MMC24_003438 [Lignoscripta atroalba]|nr:hypothetical protein [Lignoscripta atroalba]